MPSEAKVTNEWPGDTVHSLKFGLSVDPGLDSCTHMNTRLPMKSYCQSISAG